MGQRGQAADAGMHGLRQQRQQRAADIGLNHARFVGQVGRIAGGMNAQDMPFRLQCSLELARSSRRTARHDDPLDERIGQDFFQIAYQYGIDAPASQSVESRLRSGVDGQLMPARFDEGPSHIQTIDVITEKCKAHGVLILGWVEATRFSLRLALASCKR
jgi:hypothetical protein